MEFKNVSLSHPLDFFQLKQLTVEPGTCFVLMPFAQEFQLVYDTIVDALKGLMICTRADDLRIGAHILERILQGIATAELVIADLTGRNPNVFYELALAHTRTKDVLLLTQNMEDVPFDLRPFFCHEYRVDSRASLEKLAKTVRNAVEDIYSRKMPRSLEGASTRTKRILDYMDQLLHNPDRGAGLVIRIQAHLSSLGNFGRVDSPDAEMRQYSRYLEEERELLIQLLEKGAVLQAILSPYRVSTDAQETSDERSARIDRVISFLSRNDECLSRCQFVVAPSTSSNLLFFGDQILFEGHKTGVERGFGWTTVVSDLQQVNMRIKIFDSYFESARKYTLERYGENKEGRNDPESLKIAVIRALQGAKVVPL